MRSLHASIFKKFLKCAERKRSSRGQEKENNEKLDCRRNKFVLIDSRRPSNKVYAHIRTKGIKKKLTTKVAFEAIIEELKTGFM